MKRFFLPLLGIAFLTFLLRWNSFTAPLERDEGEYLYDARVLLSGGLPYRDSNSQKPPLIFYTYAVGELINPTAIWPPRLLAFGFEVITIFLVGLIARKKWGSKEAFIAVPLFALMLNFPPLAPFAANTEIFALLPFVSIIYIYIKYKEAVSRKALFLAGFLAACSILYKPIVVYMLAFIFTVWLWRIKKKVPFLILGGLFAATLFLGYFAYRDGLKSFWECAVYFNAAYASQFGWGLGNLISRFSSFASYWWVILLLSVWYFIRPPKDWWWSAGVLGTGLLAVFQSPIGHYYLILMPVWALVVTYSINNLANFIENKCSLRNVSWYLAIVTLILMILPIRNQFLLSPKNLALWIYGYGSPFLESEMVAQKLAAITTSKDLVFIAGSEPQILHYAGRWSVSRFVTTYSLSMDTPKKLEYQQEAINDLTQRPPAAIVVVPGEDSGLFYKDRPSAFVDYLLTLLATDYQLQGGFVRTTQGGFWKDILESDDISSTSLLLFKRIKNI